MNTKELTRLKPKELAELYTQATVVSVVMGDQAPQELTKLLENIGETAEILNDIKKQGDLTKAVEANFGENGRVSTDIMDMAGADSKERVSNTILKAKDESQTLIDKIASTDISPEAQIRGDSPKPLSPEQSIVVAQLTAAAEAEGFSLVKNGASNMSTKSVNPTSHGQGQGQEQGQEALSAVR